MEAIKFIGATELENWFFYFTSDSYFSSIILSYFP
jgi:hypothetical protein